MAAARRGTVFLSEDTDHEPFEGELHLGTFSGHHEGTRDVLASIDARPLAEALAWARERAETVILTLGDHERFSAGDVDEPGLPRWPDDRVVERRRPPGEEWRDRSPGDSPVAWAVEVELTPPFVEPRPDWEPVVGTLAAAADALRWDRGSLRADPGAALLADEGVDDDGTFAGYDRASFVLELVVDAATADLALRAGVERCAAPRGWSVLATAQPPRRCGPGSTGPTASSSGS